METPKNRVPRPRHTPTPKMSERKKCLFTQDDAVRYKLKSDGDSDSDDSLLGNLTPLASESNSNDGISVLQNEWSPHVNYKTYSMKRMIKSRTLSPDNLSNGAISPELPDTEDKENHGEVVLKTPGTQTNGGSHAPKLSFRKASFHDISITPTAVPNEFNNQRTDRMTGELKPEISKARTSLSFVEPGISVDKFYSSNLPSARSRPQHRSIPHRPIQRTKNRSMTTKLKSVRSLGTINKHILPRGRKPQRKAASKPQQSHDQVKLQILTGNSVILKNLLLRLERKRKISETDLSAEQRNMANKILRDLKNPLERARPLSVNMSIMTNKLANKPEAIESTVSEMGDEKVVENRIFKSRGRSSLQKNIFQINTGIMGTVINGKISFLPPAKKKKPNEDDSFKEIKNSIDNILQQLSDEQDALDTSESVQSEIFKPASTNDCMKLIALLEDSSDTLRSTDTKDTTDDQVGKHLSMDGIEPIAVSTDMIETNSTPNNVTLSPTSQISSLTSELVLDRKQAGVASENNTHEMTSPKLFPIFQKGVCQATPETQQPKVRESKVWQPIGDKQYQLDVGQKEFGPKQCATCGLVYTVHEPEEELLHEKYHNSHALLKFKGWVSEQIVCHVPEWGVFGRIIYVTPNDSKMKVKRIDEILELADNEIGATGLSTGLLGGLNAYIAIGHEEIIGVCVAKSIEKAHRLVEIDSLETFSNDEYPAKCGIAKLWTSPGHRRKRVATQLVDAVKKHFIYGYLLSSEEIAFSSPTDDGKLFGSSYTKQSDFLVYQ